MFLKKDSNYEFVANDWIPHLAQKFGSRQKSALLGKLVSKQQCEMCSVQSRMKCGQFDKDEMELTDIHKRFRLRVKVQPAWQ
jgi:hypothetical protein